MGECPSNCTCPVRYPVRKSAKKITNFCQKTILISFIILKPIRKSYMSAVEIACPRSYTALNKGVCFCSFQEHQMLNFQFSLKLLNKSQPR